MLSYAFFIHFILRDWKGQPFLKSKAQIVLILFLDFGQNGVSRSYKIVLIKKVVVDDPQPLE